MISWFFWLSLGYVVWCAKLSHFCVFHERCVIPQRPHATLFPFVFVYAEIQAPDSAPTPLNHSVRNTTFSRWSKTRGYARATGPPAG